MKKAAPDRRTRAIVLRRTNYGEADRILQLLTPEGKIAVMARGVRRERSKMAGGIELFSVSDVTLHRGRGDLAILTSAKLVEHFDALVADIDLIERAGVMMKEVGRYAEQIDSPEFFDLLRQALRAMQAHAAEEGRWRELLRAWWSLNLARAGGEDVNLRFDVNGTRLREEMRYAWDSDLMALRGEDSGGIGVEHIKLMRLMLVSPFELILKVRGWGELLDEVTYVAKCVERARI